MGTHTCVVSLLSQICVILLSSHYLCVGLIGSMLLLALRLVSHMLLYYVDVVKVSLNAALRLRTTPKMLDILRRLHKGSQFTRLPKTEYDADRRSETGDARQPSFLLTLICLTSACVLCWVMGILTARLWMIDRDCIRHFSMSCKLKLTGDGRVSVLG